MSRSKYTTQASRVEQKKQNDYLRRVADTVTREYARRFVHFIVQKAELVLETYYSYKPITPPDRYRRSYYFQNHFYEPFIRQTSTSPNRMICSHEGGIHVGNLSSQASPYNTKMSVEEVWTHNMAGYHGNARFVTTPSPYEALVKYADDFTSRISAKGVQGAIRRANQTRKG